MNGTSLASTALGLAFSLAAAAAPLREIDSLASAELEARRIPGMSLVVLQRDDVVFAKGYGYADEAREIAAIPTTVFQLGSISKQFLAALVVRLSEQRRVSLDAPVTRYLPEFTGLPAGVRVRALLDHTSGIREPFLLPAYQAGIEDLARTSDEMNAILRGLPVDFPPGSRWSYSNANYQILALLVERVTGKPYERALDEAFFRPHALSSLRPCTPAPRDRREARGHVLRHGSVVAAAFENFAWIRGDGGLCGHALDVARWTRLLATGRIVSPRSYRTMTAPARVHGDRVVDYGLGLSLVTLDGRPKVAHNGAMLGHSATAAYYPGSETTVVVLTNHGDVRTEAIERAVARRLLGLAPPDLRAQPLSSGDRQRFAGRYDLGLFPIRIVDREGVLWIEVPPPGPTSALRYLGNGEFACESDPDACSVSFAGRETPAPEARVYMGGMHWYGGRR